MVIFMSLYRDITMSFSPYQCYLSVPIASQNSLSLNSLCSISPSLFSLSLSLSPSLSLSNSSHSLPCIRGHAAHQTLHRSHTLLYTNPFTAITSQFKISQVSRFAAKLSSPHQYFFLHRLQMFNRRLCNQTTDLCLTNGSAGNTLFSAHINCQPVHLHRYSTIEHLRNMRN